MLALAPSALGFAIALLAQTAAAASAVTVSVPGPTVTVTVSPKAVTVVSTKTATRQAATATLLSTSILTSIAPDVTSTLIESASVTITATEVDPTIATTSIWLEAPTRTIVESVDATATVSPRDIFSNYFGCFVIAAHESYNMASNVQYDVNLPSPYTASTAVAECHYQLSAAQSAHPSAAFTYCAVFNDGSIQLTDATASNLAYDNFAARAASDSMCDQNCAAITSPGVVNAVVADGYGAERCGSVDGAYVSLYALNIQPPA